MRILYPSKNTTSFSSSKQNQGFYLRKWEKKIASEISWLFKTVTDDTGKEHFTIVYAEFNPRIHIYPNQLYLGYLSEDSNLIPDAIFRQNFAAVRKNPFSLETLAKVKMATSGVNLEGETFSFIPTKIKDELKKYQDVNTKFISGLAECSSTETWWHREDWKYDCPWPKAINSIVCMFCGSFLISWSMQIRGI